MAINLDDRYPGRAGPKNLAYPQGSFKNRTSPTSKDGTYLEKDWANDWAGFFQALLSDAGMTANGVVDTAQASQYFDALMAAVGNRFAPTATFAEIDALTSDQGPIFCSDMAGDMYVWVSTAYFTGYRNPRSGLWYGGASDTPEAWELLATGGTWTTSNPKHARVIARYREWGRTVASGAWTKGWNHIADLGGGNWKAPDLRDVFQRMSGTDADTANPSAAGTYKTDTVKAHAHEGATRYPSVDVATSVSPNRYSVNTGTSTGTYGTAETAPEHTRVPPVVLV